MDFWTIINILSLVLGVVILLAFAVGFVAKKIGESRGLDMSYKTYKENKK